MFAAYVFGSRFEDVLFPLLMVCWGSSIALDAKGLSSWNASIQSLWATGARNFMSLVVLFQVLMVNG